MNSIDSTCARISAPLQAMGFYFGFESTVARQAHFYRPSPKKGLWQVVEVTFVGRSNEAVAASTGASVTRLILYKGLTDLTVIPELATDVERGVALVGSARDMKLWEQTFEALVPQALERHAQTGELLTRTREARDVADAMVRMIDVDEEWGSVVRRLRGEASAEAIEEVERLVAGGIVQVSDSLDAYRIACLSLQRVRGRAIGTLSRNVAEFQRIAWPIQIVADTLIASVIERGLRDHRR